jgi:O-antigen ligase
VADVTTGLKHAGAAGATVVVASLAGYLTATSPTMAVYVAILVAGGLVAHWAKLSTLEFLSVLLPVSFVVSIGFDLNVSMADAALPIAITAIVSDRAPAHLPTQAFTRAAFVYAVSLISVAAVSLLVALATYVTLDFRYGAVALLKMAISVGYLFAFYHLTLRSVTVGDFRFLAAWGVTASAIASLSIVGYALYTSGVSTPFTQDYRLVGTFKDPNLFSSYLVISFCVVLMSRIVHPSTWKAPAALVILAGIVLTGSRAVIPAVLAGLVFAVLTTRGARVARRQLLPIGVVGTVLVGASFLVWNPIERLESVSRILTSEYTVSSDGRIQLWFVAWRMWQEHPVLGVGIGQYRAVADQYVFGGVSNIPHNTYLSFLAETGVVGLVVFLSLPLAILVRVVRSRRRGNVFAPLLELAIVAVAVQAFTLNLENSRALWALLGISAALCDVAMRREHNLASLSRRA